MKIIVSPAKKMKTDTEGVEASGLPIYIEKAKKILDELKKRDFISLKRLWACNDRITEENVKRLQTMDLLTGTLTPALLSYEGIAFKYMAPTVFDEDMLSYVQKHLYILSGFYGALKALDGITPYRLEMQAKIRVDGHRDLYSFWGDSIYKEVKSEDGILINLASKEYARCVENYVGKGEIFLTCHFGERIQGTFHTKGTYAKMARGEMVRYLAENKVETVEEIKGFCGLGYEFDEKYSTQTDFYFNRVGKDEGC